MAADEATNRAARWAGAALLIALACYGVWSFPGLVTRWDVTPQALVLLAGWIVLAMMIWQFASAAGWPGQWIMMLGLAIGCRIAMAILFGGHQAGGDAYCYPQIAQNLLAGKGYVIDDPDIGPRLRALFPPGYATLLAGWGFMAGFSTLSLSALNLILDGLTALLIARLGQRLDFQRAGVVAAWLYLIWPALLLSAPLAQKESLINLLVLLLAHYWITPGRPASAWRNALALGLPTGLLALVQPNLAPLSAVMGLVLMSRGGLAPLVRRASGGMVVALILIMPWCVRNWMLFGAFVPFSSSAGVSLWIGNNPAATGNWIRPPSFPGLGERAYMAKVTAIALDWIRNNPADFIRLTATKFVRATGIAVAGVVRMETLQPALRHGVPARFFPFSQVSHTALLTLSGYALGRARSNAAWPLLALLAACGLQICLFDVWFEFSERHCQFILPFLLLLTCSVPAPSLTFPARAWHRAIRFPFVHLARAKVSAR